MTAQAIHYITQSTRQILIFKEDIIRSLCFQRISRKASYQFVKVHSKALEGSLTLLNQEWKGLTSNLQGNVVCCSGQELKNQLISSCSFLRLGLDEISCTFLELSHSHNYTVAASELNAPSPVGRFLTRIPYMNTFRMFAALSIVPHSMESIPLELVLIGRAKGSGFLAFVNPLTKEVWMLLGLSLAASVLLLTNYEYDRTQVVQ